MAVTFSPIFNHQCVDSTGAPASGWKVNSYAAGTSTPLSTYTTETGDVAQSNPIVLNSLGFPTTGQIWLTEGIAYKLVLTDADDVVQKTEDNIVGVPNLATDTVTEWITYASAPTYISGTSFSVTGDQRTTFNVGRRIKSANTAGTIYSTISAVAYTTITTVTVVNDSGTLDSGLSSVSYGIISSENGSLPVRRDVIQAFADVTDPTKRLRVDVANIPTGTVVVQATGAGGILPAGIGPLPYAGSSIPTGWLECNGAAVSRTTYAALFSAISTTWGTGDGSTTFNLPDMRGKTPIGDGTGTSTESGEDADVDTGNDTLTVASNVNKWVTGMAVVFNLTSGTITGLSDNTTYYVIRASATTIKLASTLANAQNGTAIDLTAKTSPVWDITYNFSARTLGEYGGEESHAMSSTELVAHVHTVNLDTTGGSGTVAATGGDSADTTMNSGSKGGNAAMNIMQPFAVVKYIISY